MAEYAVVLAVIAIGIFVALGVLSGVDQGIPQQRGLEDLAVA